jgi:hypothetical protein
VAERIRCSAVSLAKGEPRYATASTVRRWILIEEPGPWGRDAVRDSRLPGGAGPVLKALAKALGARALLIRRHGRSDPARRTCLVACTTERIHRVERLTFGTAADLLDLDWSPLVRDEPVGGDPVTRPVYLVCTNGRHDVCCAEKGRRLAAALAPSLGDDLWECSHYGGDRFAGNLVCLPHGLYYGQVEPERGPGVAAAYAAGRIDLDHYRGRSAHPFVVQAADYFVREREGLLGLDDLVWERRVGLDAGNPVVPFTDRTGRRLTATVEVRPDPEAQLLSCGAGTYAHPPRYRLVRLETSA